ncbi:MAG: hypothetical protein LBM96_00445 [Methanobrevibacter sp.]|jgi:hypothetical protein|nr:hypothetical protein [Candidatus Methanoflexus mossambicus]
MINLDKKHIILLGIIAVIIIVGASTFLVWYNSQFDENLIKASGYQEISLKASNDDFHNEFNLKITDYSLIYDKNGVKSSIYSLKEYSDESESANKNVKKYLIEAKKYAKNDIEKNYVDLLINKSDVNTESFKTMSKLIDIIGQYVYDEISLSEFSQKLFKLNNESSKIQSQQQKINNDIKKLLVEHPEFKLHIQSLNLDSTYLGEKVY